MSQRTTSASLGCFICAWRLLCIWQYMRKMEYMIKKNFIHMRVSPICCRYMSLDYLLGKFCFFFFFTHSLYFLVSAPGAEHDMWPVERLKLFACSKRGDSEPSLLLFSSPHAISAQPIIKMNLRLILLHKGPRQLANLILFLHAVWNIY